MSKGIKIVCIIICCLFLVGTMGAVFRVKNETSNDNKPSMENSGEITPDENGNYPYYLGECTVFEDDNIYIKPEKATVKVGDKFRLNVVSKNNSTITYGAFDQNEGVLDVDERGNVTALGVGTGMISITIPEHLYLIKITVEEA